MGETSLNAWIIILWIGGLILSIAMIVSFFEMKIYIKKQNEILEKQNEMILAQLHLLSSIAHENKVPLEDINEVTKKFDIEYIE